ncbi:hypothetical protein GCM10010191_48140 [Actinomadura vinacea]|uniref:DUF1109 domain-containing protein n=1 Tax=Actinomadura vinacea TaxID=115336 RepID=A0ABN3JIQ8_9ACTN
MKIPYGLGSAGILLIVAPVLVWLNPFRWIVLGDLRWALPFVVACGLGVLGFAGIRAALTVDGWRRWTVAALAICTGLAALPSVGLGLFILMFRDVDQRVAAVSPDGRFRIVVHDTANVIDPVEGVYLQTTEGPFSRRAYFGCFNLDAGTPIQWVKFSGPNTVTVQAEKQWTLRFDPDDMRAVDTLPDDMCAKGLYTD